jgi:hypothetical protein
MTFANDVFISYEHVDDLPLDPARPGQSAGWVTTLVQHLENFLGQEIGRAEGFTVWKDKYNLRGNNSLTPEIKAELERTAIFIAILSPGYLASAWCPDEARFFAQRFAGNLAGRVFVVEKAKLDDAAVVPQQLTGLRNYRFGMSTTTSSRAPLPRQCLDQKKFNISGRSSISRATFSAT